VAVNSIADPLPAPVPAPYDGSQYVAMGVGGFIVTVAAGGAVNERTITAVGFVPDNVNPVAIKKIQTTVTRVKFLDPPCAVCAGGENPPDTTTAIQIGGSASITANTANGAAYCAGVTPTAAAYSQGTIGTNGSPNITPTSDVITVDVHGNWSSGWNGWLVVAGNIQISGNVTMNGLVYAQNDVALHGSGGGSIAGAVISTNRLDSPAANANVDTDDI